MKKTGRRPDCVRGNWSSSFLFPFVFWVCFVISLIIRYALWVNSYPLTGLGRQVRVSGVAFLPLDQNTSNPTLAVSGIEIRLNPNDKTITENSQSLWGKKVSAVGILTLKLPSNKFSGLVLDKAQIENISAQTGQLQKAIFYLYRLAFSWRRSFAENLSAAFPETQANLITGMLIGGSHFSNRFYQELRQAGLLHLTAVSGYNISIVAVGAGIIVLLFCPNRLFALIIICLSISFYILITGGGASVIRAGIMGVLGFIAGMAGSQKSSRRIFLLAVGAMLFIRPSWINDFGWQLSAVATAGLLWFEPIILRFIGGKSRRAAGFRHEVSAVLAASLATMPILAARLGWERVSWSGVLINLPAGLLVAPIMAIGILVGFIGYVSPFTAGLVAIASQPVPLAMIFLVKIGAWINQIIVT